MNPQDEKELFIFEKFAAHCLLFSIDVTSITKCHPPEPDIRCQLSDGNFMAFELVECIDSDLAKKVYGDYFEFKELMERKLKKLPRDEMSFIKHKYKDALICIVPNKGLSFSRLQHAAGCILKYLRDFSTNKDGKYDICRDTEMGKIISSIFITNGLQDGPEICLNTFTMFADPCAELLAKKFTKKYETDCKIDLLAYYYLQPTIPENLWLPSVNAVLEDKFQASMFNRVWIYSATANKIILSYPGI